MTGVRSRRRGPRGAAILGGLVDGDDPRLFRALFDASPDAVVIVDAAGTIRCTNPACAALLGYSAPELEGRRVEILVPGRYPDHARHRESYQSAPRARGMGVGLELVARHKDGCDLPVDISLTPLEHEGGTWVAATMRDMRGRAYAGDTLRVQATALRSAANGIVITDRSGIISWVNPAACSITGYAADELVGRHTRTLKSGVHPPEFYAALWSTVLAGDTWSGTIVNRRKDGALYHEEQTIAPVVDPAGEISHFIAIKQDVTARQVAEAELAQAREDLAARVVEIERLNAQLREQALRDPLTGLHNRRYFQETIARDVSAAERKREPLTILTIDVDDFKRVNDEYGHGVGDSALLALANVIRSCFRASDIACRFGGEEFVVVLPGAPLDVARQRAESLRSNFERAPLARVAGASVHATISVGVSALHVGAEEIDQALERADAALYEAKRDGKNRVVIAEADARTASERPVLKRHSQ